MDKGVAARLNANTLQHLSSKGYSVAWLQEGRLPKFSGTYSHDLPHKAEQDRGEYSSEPVILSEQEVVLLRWFRSRTSDEQESFFRLFGIKLQTDFAQSA